MKLQLARQTADERRKTINPRYKPGYHLSVPAGWLNDPNGFGFFQGQFHLFYQFHPYDSVWGPMHWGHWVSEDLAHWQDRPVALAPDQPYDEAGCFSGTSLVKDGKLVLMYTGVSPNGKNGCFQQQCMAESADGVHFEKWADNPVIRANQLPQGASPDDFRDPKVERTAEGYRVTLASRGQDGGQLLRYSSPDLHKWTFVGVYADHLGEMSECPDVFELDGQTVVIFCEMGADQERFGAPQVTLYAVGQEKNGRLNAETPLRLVDCGLDFYAPQSMQTPDGRRVLIGWALSWSHVMPTHTLGHGWAGMMTLPRECTLDEMGALCQQPVRELKSLRKDEVKVEGASQMSVLSGRQREMELCIDMKEAQTMTLSLMETGDERFTLAYDCPTETLRADRSQCGYPLTVDLQPEPKPWSEAKVPLKDGKLYLHVFVDASIVEIYADEGRAAMSCLAFPKGENYGVSLQSDGPVSVSGRGWTL